MTYIAKIYKIVNNINDDIYVGSTKNELRVRWQGHKCYAKKIPDQNGLYQMMNEYSFNCFRMVLIETVECENKEEQVRHEQLFIDALKPKLNKHNAYGNKCEHNKQQSNCKICKGTNICKHNKQRTACIECHGASICKHNKHRGGCQECHGASICVHDKIRSVCKICGGGSICEHNRHRYDCKECGNPIKKTIQHMINSSKHNDQKYNRYDANNFIDKCFLEGLVEEYTHCYWSDCKIKLQFVNYQDDLATIERLDNSIGHTKANCVFACLKCNLLKKSNMVNRINHTVPENNFDN